MIEKLLEYQKEDAGLRQIEKKLADSEERKIVSSARKFLEGVEESINSLESKAENLANRLERIKNERQKLLEQKEEIAKLLKTVADENEVNFFIKKTDELIAQIKALSQSISDLGNEMQSVLGEYVSLWGKTKIEKEKYTENITKYNELKALVKPQKDEIEKKLAEIKEKVDPELMERYLKKREGKIYPVVFGVNSNFCPACGVELSASLFEIIKSGEVVEHECGRLLYWEK